MCVCSAHKRDRMWVTEQPLVIHIVKTAQPTLSHKIYIIHIYVYWLTHTHTHTLLTVATRCAYIVLSLSIFFSLTFSLSLFFPLLLTRSFAYSLTISRWCCCYCYFNFSYVTFVPYLYVCLQSLPKWMVFVNTIQTLCGSRNGTRPVKI